MLACSSVKNSLIFAQSGKKSGHITPNVKLERYEGVKLFRALYEVLPCCIEAALVQLTNLIRRTLISIVSQSLLSILFAWYVSVR